MNEPEPQFGTAQPRRRRGAALAIVIAAIVIGTIGALLAWRAAARVNESTLAAVPRPVAFVAARADRYRDARTYVGTIEPWVEANIGPQYIAAYVDTVRVRPGDVVARGAVVATLDCSNPRATSRAAEMQAHSVDARQRAAADEAERYSTLAREGFAAENDSELKRAQSDAERSQLSEARARVTAAELGVHDCVLAAPFDGEIATRVADPGAFVRPGEHIVSVVDRRTDRITADVPEKDFDVVAVGTEVSIDVLATGAHLAAKVSRRAPKADPATRTVHCEIDVPDPSHAIPVGTTAVLHVDVGQAVAASALPSYAAVVRGDRASLFVVDGAVARAREVPVLGEIAGTLYLAPAQLPPGTQVITEGRAQLADGDRIAARAEPPPPAAPASSTATRGAGNGRPI